MQPVCCAACDWPKHKPPGSTGACPGCCGKVLLLATQHDPVGQSVVVLQRATHDLVELKVVHPAPTGTPGPIWQHAALFEQFTVPIGIQTAASLSEELPSGELAVAW